MELQPDTTTQHIESSISKIFSGGSRLFQEGLSELATLVNGEDFNINDRSYARDNIEKQGGYNEIWGMLQDFKIHFQITEAEFNTCSDNYILIVRKLNPGILAGCLELLGHWRRVLANSYEL